MRLSFYVGYQTEWGESVAIEFTHSDGSSVHHTRLEMKPLHNGSIWVMDLESDAPYTFQGLKYRYLVTGPDGTLMRREWRDHRVPDFEDSGADQISLFDSWLDRPDDLPYFSTLFTDCVCRRPDSERASAIEIKGGRIIIEIAAPLVPSDCYLAVSGSTASLGEWNPEKALRCSDASYPLWKVSIPLDTDVESFRYKFLIIRKETGNVVAWETGDDRLFVMPTAVKRSDAIVISGLKLRDSSAAWRGAGVAIPVFSLRSEDDFGIGDFADIKKMGEWAASTGQSIIQLLPVNDTTMTGRWTDSYPYNSISSFALHPVYIRLEDAGTLKDQERMIHYGELRRELQEKTDVDYEAVFAAKMAYMSELFDQDGDATVNTEAFKIFVGENEHWLAPYAAFCVLRDQFGTPDMRQWGEYRHYDNARVADFMASHKPQVDFVYFMQYHLDRQLKEARDYVHSLGVAIKGDIPIGISRTSVDAWLYPELFNLDASAGAPPDDFAVNGQNWGFPTYNWEAMARDNFQWWKNRFRHMARYFDAYRIDHVLGFFRIWQIPLDQIHGLLGVFNPALPFTANELYSAYGFRLAPELHCRPYITDWVLTDIFGDNADDVKRRFLLPDGAAHYKLKPEFATQRAIADWGESLPQDSRDRSLVEPLQGLIDQVLFLPDPVLEGKWHPRISAQTTYPYLQMDEHERRIFDALYNDFFYRRNDSFWKSKAMEKLPPITEATDMLTCAEDLGMIPACVPSVMDSLRILALEIQRMPKAPDRQFGDPSEYPYLSVCATSTHDMPGIRGWWEMSHTVSQAFFNHILHQSGIAPKVAEPWICNMIVASHLQSPSMLCILPLQDYLSIDPDLRRDNPMEEVINDPANPHNYWHYRMHITLEKLIASTDFNSRLRSMIVSAGR